MKRAEISINLIERIPADTTTITFGLTEQSVERLLEWLRQAKPGERVLIDGLLDPRYRMKVERTLGKKP